MNASTFLTTVGTSDAHAHARDLRALAGRRAVRKPATKTRRTR